jgi:3-methyl-2-oxobutanoate hydroxymethyltransferase
MLAGHETTLPITLDQMIYHASVVRAIERALVVVILPGKLSIQKKAYVLPSNNENGGHAVESGKKIKESIKKILNAGIP